MTLRVAPPWAGKGHNFEDGGVPIERVASMRMGFAPSDVNAELLLWLEADQIVGGHDDPVSFWPDLSPREAGFEQATAANQPTLQKNVQNGRAAVLFDGTDAFLDYTGDENLLNPSLTLFVVAEDPNDTTVRYIMGRQNAGDNGGMLVRQVSNAWQIQAIDNGAPFPTASVDPSPGGDWFIGTFRAGEATTTARIDDGVASSTADRITEFDFNPGFASPIRIGRRPDSDAHFWNKHIAAILVYGHQIDTADETLVREYLNERYATF